VNFARAQRYINRELALENKIKYVPVYELIRLVLLA
jgi:hypothetical protein